MLRYQAQVGQMEVVVYLLTIKAKLAQDNAIRLRPGIQCPQDHAYAYLFYP